mmetsp:Transcript_2868/g.5364  ORF Transcript_2868/g.5364 Transcript_2868/m.5364 type:complete len:109 (+) Transcript_2868:779-1105(+)
MGFRFGDGGAGVAETEWFGRDGLDVPASGALTVLVALVLPIESLSPWFSFPLPFRTTRGTVIASVDATASHDMNHFTTNDHIRKFVQRENPSSPGHTLPQVGNTFDGE